MNMKLNSNKKIKTIKFQCQIYKKKIKITALNYTI